MKILELENEPLGKLRNLAKGLNIPNANRLKKETLAMMIREAEAQKEGIELRGGILEIMRRHRFPESHQLPDQRSGRIRLTSPASPS